MTGACSGITICRLILFLFWLCWAFVAGKAFLWLRRAGAVLSCARALDSAVAPVVEHGL